MSSLAASVGLDVVSRATAERLGTLSAAVLDVPSRKLVAWQIGTGRHALIADTANVRGIEDAVVLEAESSARPTASPEEQATVDGKRPLLQARVLTDAGEEIGPVQDVEFDPETGAVGNIVVPGGPISADRLRGLGGYALVVTTS